MSDFGQIVRVDLEDGSQSWVAPDRDLIDNFLGGRGVNAYYLLKELDEDIGPFSSENPIIFTPGLLTGSDVYSSSRLHVSSLSPLTGFLGSSSVGGYLGAGLKSNGIFSLIIEGKSDLPVFIWIDGGGLEIRSAEAIWGMNTSRARKKIEEEGDGQVGAGAIGPAGENMASMACITLDNGHAAGRTGMGAVMGSKKLKAIGASPGDYKIGKEIGNADPVREFLEEVKSHPDYDEWSQYDNSTSVKWADELGAGTVNNYRQVQAENIEQADGRSFKDLPRKPSSCHRCPVHCKAELEITRGPHEGEKAERPCYEPLVALGPKCGNFDVMETIDLHNRCNELGLDSVEVGGLLAFAMDLYDRGIISREDAGGLDLNWGNTGAMDELLEMIAGKKGWFGKVLSKGLVKAAEEIGGKAKKFAYHVKGLAMTAMDPRGFKGSALGYAVGSRGGDFTGIYARPEYSFSPEQAGEVFGKPEAADRLTEEGKPELVKRSAIVSAIVDSLGICKVPLLSLVEDYDSSLSARLTSEITGKEISSEELLLIGERIVTAERMFNVRMGLTSEDDRLPAKFTSEEIESGPAEGEVVELDKMLDEYYSLMGWTAEGPPKRDRLKELGLDHLARD